MNNESLLDMRLPMYTMASVAVVGRRHTRLQRGQRFLSAPGGTDSSLRPSYASLSNVSLPEWRRLRSTEPLPRIQTQGLVLSLVQRQHSDSCTPTHQPWWRCVCCVHSSCFALLRIHDVDTKRALTGEPDLDRLKGGSV
jgi:hypothetical protein